MSFRFVGVASISLALSSLALAQATTQASAAPATDDSVPPITVQVAPPPISISSAMLGVSSPLGAQATIGKAMFAEFVTEHHQSFTDGNRISHSTRSSIYRDSLGRIRRESQLSMPGLAAGVSTSTFITIIDRQLGYGYVLDPQEMVAHRYELNAPGSSYVARISAQGNGNALLSPDSKQPAESATTTASATSSATSHWHLHTFSSHRNHAADTTASTAAPAGQLNSGFLPGDSAVSNAPAMRIDQPFLAAPNPVRTESLGEQPILGFLSVGTRVITTLPAGQIGNDRPIDIVSEQWFSPELDLVMRSMHRDPWAGEFTTTVIHISRGDQPASLFGVPEHYKIIDAATENEHHVLDGHGNHPPGPAPW